MLQILVEEVEVLTVVRVNHIAMAAEPTFTHTQIVCDEGSLYLMPMSVVLIAWDVFLVKLNVTNMYIVHSSVNVMHQHLPCDPCVKGALRITCMEALPFATHVLRQRVSPMWSDTGDVPMWYWSDTGYPNVALRKWRNITLQL